MVFGRACNRMTISSLSFLFSRTLSEGARDRQIAEIRSTVARAGWNPFATEAKTLPQGGMLGHRRAALDKRRAGREGWHADARPRIHLGAALGRTALSHAQSHRHRDRPRAVHRRDRDA